MITASDRAEAHAIATVTTRPIDLVICDVVLPDVPGTVVVADVKKQWPAATVILMSGYNDAREEAANTANVFLPKPFMPAEVRAAVAQLLPQQT